MSSSQEASPSDAPALLGSSPAIAHVRYFIEQVGPSESTCLVTGPSGTGKEVVANLLHRSSPRRAAALVALNCGAVPADLIESELFGHEKGAFTGAIARRIGRFEAADGGTLFLDEIGDMPAEMQVKLLRVLEERRLERVGGSTPIRIDARIVGATHRSLEAEIEAGRFREDLFYRINIFPIRLPALCERREDVAELAAHFARRLGGGEAAFKLDSSAVAALSAYDWPGNVRELRNFAERAAVLHRGRQMTAGEANFLLSLGRARAVIDAGPAVMPVFPVPAAAQLSAMSDPASNVLPFPLKVEADEPLEPAAAWNPAAILAKGGLNLRDLLADIEQSFITSALEQCDYTVADAARLLGLQRTTLCEKMRKYDMKRAVVQHAAFA